MPDFPWFALDFKYRISDLDTAGDPQYFGYLSKDGEWYIMQLTSTAARYARGESDYTTNWTGRVGLSYNYFNVIFG